MITRGSKFYFAAAAVGFVSALLYGFVTGAADHGGVIAVFTDGAIVDSVIGPISFGWKGWIGEHVGYTVLMVFSGVMLALGGFTTAFRDGDAEALAELDGVDVADVPEPTRPWGVSFWPLLCALGAGVVVVGLALSTFLFWVGIVLLALGGVEWMVRSWSERASGDHAANAAYRDRILRPVELPLAAVVVILVVALAISRLLLAVPKSAAVYIIIGLAIAVFGVAILLSKRPELSGRVVGVVALLSLLVVIGAGIAGGVAGEREIEEHHSEEEALATADAPVPSAPDGMSPTAPGGI